MEPKRSIEELTRRHVAIILQINMRAKQETTEILRLLRLLWEHAGVRLDKSANGRAFEEETKHTEIVRQIRGDIEERAPAERRE